MFIYASFTCTSISSHRRSRRRNGSSRAKVLQRSQSALQRTLHRNLRKRRKRRNSDRANPLNRRSIFILSLETSLCIRVSSWIDHHVHNFDSFWVNLILLKKNSLHLAVPFLCHHLQVLPSMPFKIILQIAGFSPESDFEAKPGLRVFIIYYNMYKLIGLGSVNDLQCFQSEE